MVVAEAGFATPYTEIATMSMEPVVTVPASEGGLTMSVRAIPNVDFSKIPSELQGKWVAVRVGSGVQEILKEGDTPHEAMAGVQREWNTILTRVPAPIAIAASGESDGDH